MPVALIHHQGRSYLLSPLADEPLPETYQRLWKIIQHHPVSDYEYDRITRVSKLWYYKRKLGCRYSDPLEALIALF